jgi:regulator of replication initiation timing
MNPMTVQNANVNQEQDAAVDSTEKDIEELKKAVKALQLENTRLTRENNDFKRLINDHAGRINKNTAGMTNLERTMRNEMTRIAQGFKKVQAALNRNKG